MNIVPGILGDERKPRNPQMLTSKNQNNCWVEGNGEGKQIQGREHEERSTVKDLPLRHR